MKLRTLWKSCLKLLGVMGSTGIRSHTSLEYLVFVFTDQRNIETIMPAPYENMLHFCDEMNYTQRRPNMRLATTVYLRSRPQPEILKPTCRLFKNGVQMRDDQWLMRCRLHLLQRMPQRLKLKTKKGEGLRL